MSSIYSEFLDIELLSRLPSLEVKARFLVSGFLAGLHKTPFRGNSVEFKEYRDYQPGDELKLIDWKAYARTDRLHIKLREEETNMTVNLLLDRSASMDYKSSEKLMTKWNYARALSAAFLLFLHRQRDAVALGFIADGLENFTRPGAHASHFHQLMVNLHRDADARNSTVAGSMHEMLSSVRRRSMVLIFSDFYEDAEALRAPLSYLRHLKCEIILFHILDPMETSFSFEDGMLMQELESNNKMYISPDLLRKEYKNAITSHISNLSSLAMEHNCEYLLLDTSTPPVHALGTYLSKRRAMR
jgi:uncharacterized protein (DUF58 family)